MFRNKSVNVHQFAMVPRADIPRSAFDIEFMHKTTFDAGLLIPFYVDEVLPGDTFRFSATMFARMATPIFPIMDNMYLDSFFFFVPYRLVWTNFVKMMGEQDNPGDSISFTVPQVLCPVGGYLPNTLGDYFGLPTAGQITGGNTFSTSSLPHRAYNLIYNSWFRDENLQTSVFLSKGDATDSAGNFVIMRRGKRHDYFTSSLPSPQKGTAVPLPLGTSAPVKGQMVVVNNVGTNVRNVSGVNGATTMLYSGNSDAAIGSGVFARGSAGDMYADLTSATAATINQIRQAFQIQRLMERDMRGGTRYTEQVTAHFGVRSPDARLQRPEYLGGGSTPLNVNPIAQTSGTSATGTTTPLGQLGAMATILARHHGFTQSFNEHGVVMGIVSIRADLTYQQGIRRFWSRQTKFDFYWPVFAYLGEQATLNKEIYCDGGANDPLTFGFQERWAEYRYFPSMVTGLFRSTTAGTLDAWHLAQKFTVLPTLNSTFISDTPPVARVVATPTLPHFLFDCYCRNRVVRPMPMYSVPGLVDHF